MVQDRLQEMQSAAKSKTKSKKEKDIDPFLKTIDDISTGINKIKTNVDNIRNIQKRILNEPFETERKKHLADHNALVEENKTICKKLQKCIKDEQAKVQKMEKNGKGKDWTDVRVKMTQVKAISNRYLEVWSEFNAGQETFRNETKQRLRKNNVITNTEMSEEQVEEHMKTGGGTFSSTILKDTAEAKDKLSQLEDRNTDILKLEESIHEIHEMFMGLQNIVTMQKDMVDRIESYVGDAEINVAKGRKDLWEGLKKKVKTRKGKVILISILAGVIVIIVIALVV